MAFPSILISSCRPFSSGFPVPEVSWYRDGQVLSAATLPGVQISFSDGRAKLVIPTVTEANSGRYTVQATNGSGQATSTAELLVTGIKQLKKGTSLCWQCEKVSDSRSATDNERSLDLKYMISKETAKQIISPKAV